MSNVSGNPMPTRTMVHRLRLFADAGGNLTRDRRDLVIQAADRLEELDERVAIMTEQDNAENAGKIDFPIYGGHKE